ncbi:MAG: DUF1622 domain-containing protein [Eubacterium sp.]|nr:DUF1622 domain-containing protein [Eubacterium sp.]
MEQLYENLENNFNLFVQYCILVVEIIGVCVLVGTVIRSVWQLLHRDPHVRLNLAKGIALSLEFKLGSEVLRTVIAREKSELIILGAIIALRGLLTFLIHWEIKTEEQRSEELRLKEQPDDRK